MQSVYMAFLIFPGIFLLCEGVCEQGAYENSVSEEERNYIVNEHNNRRLLIAKGNLTGQPRGVNLKRLVWDNDLGQAAQNIANSCVYGHVQVSDPRWQVGQNIAAGYSTAFDKGADWNEPILNWWDEYKKYKFGDGFSEETGHYTQMAWDDTQFIGCGYIHFPSSEGQYKYHKIYVCNYGPTGNFERAPYKEGDSGCEDLC